MTNVLQLFWKPPEEKPQPRLPQLKQKRKKEEHKKNATGIKVNYSCLNCGQISEFGSDSSIQCPKCNYRVLEKIREKKHITYTNI